MEKFEKIFSLLEKGTLSDEESAYLNNAAKSDKEIKKLVDVFTNLQKRIPEVLHIDLDTLASYILFENGEEPEIKSVLLLTDKIREHLEKCRFCRLEYESLQQEYNEAGQFVDSVLNEKQNQQEIKFPLFGIFSSQNFRYAFASVSVIFLVYLGLLFYSGATIETYKKGIFETGTEEVYSTRGRTSLVFQKGLDAVEHGNYDSAEKFFKEDIEKNKNDKSIFYTHYVLGITQLHSAEGSFIGLFKNYDQGKVNEAITSLKKSIELNTSGSYENINLDANYYLGRAFLLKDDIANANLYLQIVVDKKGRFFNEAKELVETISDGR